MRIKGEEIIFDDFDNLQDIAQCLDKNITRTLFKRLAPYMIHQPEFTERGLYWLIHEESDELRQYREGGYKYGKNIRGLKKFIRRDFKTYVFWSIEMPDKGFSETHVNTYQSGKLTKTLTV